MKFHKIRIKRLLQLILIVPICCLGQNDDLFLKAQQAFEAHNYEIAKNEYDSIFSSNKNLSLQQFCTGYYGLAKAHHYLSNYTEALLFQKKTLAVALEIGDTNLIFRHKIYLAEIGRASAKFELAKEILLEAKSLYYHPGISLKNKGYFHNRKAAILYESHAPFDSILFHSEKAAEYSLLIGDSASLASEYNLIAHSFLLRKDYSRAKDYLLKAIEVYKNLEDRRALADLYINIAHPLWQENAYQQVIEFSDLGIAICDTNWHLTLFGLYDHKASAYKRLKKYREALESFEKGVHHNQAYLSGVDKAKLKSVTNQLEVENAKFKLENERKQTTLVQKTLDASKQKVTFLVVLVLVAGIGIVAFGFLYGKLKNSLNNEKQLNEEKNYLLQEVHHRIKNNLQSLSSLLNIQLNFLPEQAQKDLILNVIRRVDTIGITHNMLYNSTDFIHIEAKEYLEGFSQLLEEINKDTLKRNSIKVNSIIDDIELSFEESISIGMIYSELVNNSRKYAKTENLIIDFHLTKINQDLHFFYKDNGETLIPTEGSAKGLGLKIINLFTKKLKGKMLESNHPFSHSFIFRPLR